MQPLNISGEESEVELPTYLHIEEDLCWSGLIKKSKFLLRKPLFSQYYTNYSYFTVGSNPINAVQW